jgi:hypothetical protein
MAAALFLSGRRLLLIGGVEKRDGVVAVIGGSGDKLIEDSGFVLAAGSGVARTDTEKRFAA